MKKRRALLFLALIVLCQVLVGCTKEKNSPEEGFMHFSTFLENGNYHEMYELLTRSSKEAISANHFIERYEKIHSGIEAEEIKIEQIAKEQDEEKISKNESVTIPFKQTMMTLAGEVTTHSEVEMVFDKEEKEWHVAWSPSLIFPQLDEGDKVRIETLQAKRGEIFDRNHLGLAINGLNYEIGIVPERMKSEQITVAKVANVLNHPEESIVETLNQKWVKPDMFVPLSAIPTDQEDMLEALREIQGVTYREVSARVYPYKNASAHLIGYIGSITSEEFEKLSDHGYTANDKVGKAGLEKILEHKLRGEEGCSIYIVDSLGKSKVEIARKEAVNGGDIQLTIDAHQQEIIYNKFDGEAGTAVSLNPKTGEVLSLVSSPAYNPNDFILGLSSQKWKSLNENEHKPLLNRFTQAYAPGSIMKPITAAIGLNHHWDPFEKKNIEGKQWQKDPSWGNYAVTRVTAVNPVDLTDALVHSDNIYFAQMALEIGIDNFIKGLNAFGFNETLPFSYGMSMSTVHNDGMNSEIQLADTAYGQGELLVTPLHLALMYAPFVTNGVIPKPLLYKEEIPSIWKESIISEEQAAKILADLTAVVERGTGAASKLEQIRLAGKTGTTEYKQSQQEAGKETGGFIAVNPDNSDLIMLMMIENAETRGGSKYVVPKVMEIFEELL
ncbi:penicillin-binding transpeptidase domain-containing protein [Bacillus solitudinis]|uniref:penicillin-binding transpeptidase domain-containing protein n=1 Tax=Bacillus solitudinis TaxID=2014074 RepID=UPI000C24472C|nr:penicillin-binding transpeptidase domain-containing protein [Bacillus solitudinis]